MDDSFNIPRREMVERMTLIFGASLSPQLTSALMGQVTNHGKNVKLTPTLTALLTEVADVIIPTTDTPGANQFIIRVMRINFKHFNQLRKLVITGYFTSEVGATQALEYLPIPWQIRG